MCTCQLDQIQYRNNQSNSCCISQHDNSCIPFFFSGAHLKTIPRQEEDFMMSPNLGKKAGTKENETGDEAAMQHTGFGKALYDLTHSEKVMNDLIFGRRVGLYELRGEIGSGNFSQVRLGIHDLTKGEIFDALSFVTFIITTWVIR